MPDTKLEYTRAWTRVEDFPHLGFTRSWENPADYATYEPDEMVVRRDMQSLHDEVRDYINGELIPAVVTSNSTEADRAAAEAQRQAAEQLRQAAELQRVSETEGVVARAAKEADDAKYWADRAEFIASGNVNSFNGRKGLVMPQTGDYTAEMVGAAPAVESAEYPGCYYRMVDGEREWINPPMHLSYEYRTTERYSGLPVYQRWIDLENLATHATREYQVAQSGTFKNIVDWKVSSGNPDGEMFDVDCASWGTVWFNNTSNTMSVQVDTALVSPYWAAALLKYTKQ